MRSMEARRRSISKLSSSNGGSSRYQVDHEFGGVYDTSNVKGLQRDHAKARIWKEAYHDGRALLNVTARLQKLAKAVN